MNDLLRLLTELSGMGLDMLGAAALVFLRLGAMMALLPAFGEQSVPARVRLAVALAFTMVVTPAVSAGLPEDGLPTAAAVEVLAGLVMGIGLRLMVLALQTAAALIAQGTSLAQLMGGAGPEPMPAVGQLMTMAGLALAMTAGLHLRATEFMILSYTLVPPGAAPDAAGMAEWGVAQTAHAFALAFMLAAPFTIAAMLYNLALGVINRAMPALMVSFIGAPALSGGGLVLLALLLPTLLAVWWQAVDAFLSNPALAPP